MERNMSALPQEGPLEEKAKILQEQLRYEPHSRNLLTGLLFEFKVGSKGTEKDLGNLCFLQITVDLHQSMVALLHRAGLNSARMVDHIFEDCWNTHFGRETDTRKPGTLQYEENGNVPKIILRGQTHTDVQIVKVDAAPYSKDTLEKTESLARQNGRDFRVTLQVRKNPHEDAFPSKSLLVFCRQMREHLEKSYSAHEGEDKQPILDEMRLKEIQQDLLDDLFIKQPLLRSNAEWAQVIQKALIAPADSTEPAVPTDPLQSVVRMGSTPMHQCFFGCFIPYLCGFCNVSRAFRHFSRTFLPNLLLVLVCCTCSTFKRGCRTWLIALKRVWKNFARHLFLITPLHRFGVKAILFVVWLAGPKILYWFNPHDSFVEGCSTFWEKIVAVVFDTQITTAEGRLLDTAPDWFWLYCFVDLWVQTAEVIHFWRARAANGEVGSMDISTVASFLHSTQQATHKFQPGEMGIELGNRGVVDGVVPDGQAYIKGIKKGDRIVKVGPWPYTRTGLKVAEKSTLSYKVTVWVRPCADAQQEFEIASIPPNEHGNACASLNRSRTPFNPFIPAGFRSDCLYGKFSLNPFYTWNFCRYFSGDPRPGMWLMYELLGSAFNFGQGITANDAMGAFATNLHKVFAISFALSHAFQLIGEQRYIVQRVNDDWNNMYHYNGEALIGVYMQENCAMWATDFANFLKAFARLTAYVCLLSTVAIVVTCNFMTEHPGGEPNVEAKWNAVAEFCLAMAVVSQNILRFVSELRHTRIERIVQVARNK